MIIFIGPEDIDPLSYFAMQEKEGTKLEIGVEPQEFDLLNTLDPKPDNEDEGGLEELFPEMKQKKENDDFLLKLLETDEPNKPSEDIDLFNSDIPFQESKEDAANSLFSLEDLIGDQAALDNNENLEEDEDFDSDKRKLEHNIPRSKVTKKVNKPQEEEVFSEDPEDPPTNSLPNTKDPKTFPTKQSIAETVKLDGTVGVSMASGVTNYEPVEPENIQEGISDDEDEESNKQWDEFMKESEEFGQK